MHLALELARRGEGRVEPNPMVGCVIVKGGRIVATGYHTRFGGPHAERVALQRAGPAARRATAYITLEPCGHFGKTPPCTDALIRARPRRVVVAMKDPNPLVAGRGLRALRAAGIRVDLGLLRSEACDLAAPFIKFHRERRPYVILKWAQSIDGKIATRTGDSRWITSRRSRAAAHAMRARVDAVIVGVETVLADDPDLTARLVRPRRRATRVVLDTRLRTPPRCRLVRSARSVPTLIVTGSNQAATARRRLERAGCEVVSVGGGSGGVHLGRLLDLLRAREMTNVLVEGGGKVLASFLDAGLADEARVFVAPRLIGGAAAPGPLRGLGPARMADRVDVKLRSRFDCGPDLCYHLRFQHRKRTGRIRPPR